MLKITCQNCDWSFLTVAELAQRERCPQCGIAASPAPEPVPVVKESSNVHPRFVAESTPASDNRWLRNYMAFVMLCLGALAQIPGRESERWSTMALFTGSDGQSDEEATYRHNSHEVHWVHGFPLTWVERQTLFRPASSNFNPRDENPSAITHGVKSVHWDQFLVNLFLWATIPTAMLMWLFVPRNRPVPLQS